VILLDTHIWIWWVAQDPALPEFATRLIQEHEAEGLAVSIISCWEVARKEVGKLAPDGVRAPASAAMASSSLPSGGWGGGPR
jgi:PIN domain nuclease of toxin-antitoxin system